MNEHLTRFWPGCDTVFAMNRRSGRSDAIDFIQGLQIRYRARYAKYLEYLRDGTPIKTPENFRRLSSAGDEAIVYEIKVDKYRLYLIRYQLCWYATHGREKPKDSQVPREIRKAQDIFWEWNGDKP
ncbi:hypothetical protein JOF28_001559 [Leucobacter exalbidus]|uniref:Uncharacterized protein n=1 Tax=Leucobacter exalbidus TaxID=662960 RepID=A0A940T3N1_9MICO|nr:hypothetical protein [Leucobacter exalbidus]MBP1326327.1 hypothetical protein [Leucobacter exalbidus]